MLEKLVSKTINSSFGRKAILPALVLAGSATYSPKANAQTANLTLKFNGTIGTGSQETTDLTQMGVTLYSIAPGRVGFRAGHDPDGDGVFSTEFSGISDSFNLQAGNNLRDFYTFLPTGNINITDRIPPVNMPGTPHGIQNLAEYLAWINNDYPTLGVNNRGSPVTNYFINSNLTAAQKQVVQRFVTDSNALYQTPLTTLTEFTGTRPGTPTFNSGLDWEVEFLDLNGPNGNLDWENRKIQLDNIGGMAYSVVLQEMGEAGLYQGAFTMESANLGHFIDIDRQSPQVLFNSDITSVVAPSANNKIWYSRMVQPNWDSNSGAFETGDTDPNKEIGYRKADANGVVTFEGIDLLNPIANEKKSFGSTKAMFR